MIKQKKLHQDFYKLTVNDHTLHTEDDRTLTPTVRDPYPLACASFGSRIRIRIRIKKSWIRICIKVKSRIWIRSKSKFCSRFTMEPQRAKTDLDPNKNEKSNQNPLHCWHKKINRELLTVAFVYRKECRKIHKLSAPPTNPWVKILNFFIPISKL